MIVTSAMIEKKCEMTRMRRTRGKLCVALLSSAEVPVLDIDSRSEITRIPAGTGPHDVTVAEELGKAYVTNSSSGSVSVIDLATDTVEAITGGFNDPYRLALTPDAPQVLVGNRNGGSGSPRGIAVSADGNSVYIARNTGGVSTLDRSTYAATIMNGAAALDIVLAE